MHTPNSYCIIATVPAAMHYRADMVLASALISGPIFLADWVNTINPYLALAGGVMGLFIAGFRVYEIVRGIFTKKE